MKKITSIILSIVMLISTASSIAFANDVVDLFNEPQEGYEVTLEENSTLLESSNVNSISLFSTESVTNSKNTDITRYTVLALDTSGSMSGKPMTAAKSAAIKFCEDILKADGHNYVALITLNSSSSKICDFTDDIATVSSKINSLSASGGTNTNDALIKSNAMLGEITTSSNVVKNIVLLSDGLPQSGAYSYNGAYTSSDYYDYEYANTAYATAQTLKSDYFIYSLGFFHDLSGKDLTFGRKFMSDLQNAGYYDVTNVDDLEFEFGNVADQIINPLTVELSHELKSEIVSKEIDDLTREYYDRYLYTISASITNSSNQTAKNVVCTFEVPEKALSFDEMVSSKPNKEINIGDVLSGETKKVSWDIEIKWPSADTSAIYGVHAKADNSPDMYQTNIIYVSSKQNNDNSFIFGVDQWSFSNSNTYFAPNGKEIHYMTDEDYKALTYNISNTEKNAIIKYKNSDWDGSCHGLSITSILTKMGVFKPSDIQTGKNTVYSITKNNNDSIESFITFYHMSQKLNAIQNAVGNFLTTYINDSSKLQYIENKTDKVSMGEIPLLVWFEWPNAGGGHAVVAYGHETGKWKFGGFLGFGAKEYDSRILVYDCNAPDDKDGSCIYYNNKNGGEIYIPNYEYKNDTPQLTFACNDIDILDSRNYNVSTINQKSIMTTKNLYSYTIEINGTKHNISPNTNNADLGIYSYYAPNNESGNAEMITIFSSLNDEYSVLPNNNTDSDFELSMNYENMSLSANVTSADKIVFKPNGTVSVEDNDSEFELSIVANEGYYTTPWYKTTISGSNTDTIELSQTDNGVVINGDSLSNIKIITKKDEQEIAKVINTDKTTALLTSDDLDNPIVMIDSDNDGTYDEQLETYTLDVVSTTGGKIISNQINNYSQNACVAIEAEGDEGYVFVGWSTSNGGTFENSNSLKTKFEMPGNDTTITANFKKKSSGGSRTTRYTVKFDTTGGSNITNQTIKKNSKLSEPETPTKDGFEFAGWYTEKALTTKYNFDTKVTKDITLYAAWTEKKTKVNDDNTEPTTPENKLAFTDVKYDDWFCENVKYVIENGLMNGVSETKFAPNDNLTRAMLVTILYRAAGEPEVNKSIPFADVTADSYYANAVIWAQQNGIVSGVNENEFAPDENITREQIATIIYRYAKFNGYDTSAKADISVYADSNEISEYAVEAMQYAVGSGLINGKTETTLNPQDNATRAEIAAILQRFIETNK